MKPKDLLRRATAVALADAGRDEPYFWLDEDRLLFLRLAGKGPGFLARTWLAPLTGLIRHFEAHELDLRTGAEQPLAAFNQRCARQLQAIVCHVTCIDDEGNLDRPTEVRYQAPHASVSSDGGWLLWNAADRWRAARLDGAEEAEWRSVSFPGPGAWLRGTLKWVEAEERWNGTEYVVPRLVLHRAKDPSYRREIHVTGLSDGISAGHTARNTLLLWQSDHG